MNKVFKSKEIIIPQKMSSNNKVNCVSSFKSTFAQSLTLSNSFDESSGTRKRVEKGKNPLLKQGDFGNNYNKSDEDKQKQLWNTNKQNAFENHEVKLNDDAEVLRMRQECQSLLEENRRLSGLTQSIDSVQNVVLQTKVETLQWQLDQVETSRQMHRALMEEVVRYLEKCHDNLSLLQVQQLKDKTTIERSKSLLYMAKCKFSNDLLLLDANNGRARSSTNLIDVVPSNPKTQTLSESTISYSAFKDFTWRRSPKENKTKIVPPLLPCSSSSSDTQENHVLQDYLKSLPPAPTCHEDHNSEVIIEKLSKEAFRLLRTVQNFLNTHEPSLAIPTIEDKLHTMNHEANNDFLYDFSRKKAARNSHLSSMRCSSACSVHSSTASSSNKESNNEMNCIKPKKIASTAANNEMPKTTMIRPCHPIENESGFSSMTSYHEIGLPLINSNNYVRTSISSPLTIPIDIKRASIASIPISSPEIYNCNESVSTDVGSSELKIESDDLMRSGVNHRRWDSVPIISQNKLKIHSNDKNSMRVLWV